MISQSFLHEALLDEFDLDDLLLNDDPLGDVVLVHQPEDLVLLVEAALDQVLDADDAEQDGAQEHAYNDYHDGALPAADELHGFCVLFLHEVEDDVVDDLVGVVDLDNVLKGEVGVVVEEGQDLLQEEVVVVLQTFQKLPFLDVRAAPLIVLLGEIGKDVIAPSCI